MSSDKKVKDKTTKSSPFRTGVIVPTIAFTGLFFLYAHSFLDHHLKKMIEYTATRFHGAEVNLDYLNLNFIESSLVIKNVQITNPKNPMQNSFEIEKLHFDLSGDALLRMKFVMDDASIHQLKMNTPRKKAGKIIPMSPAKPSKVEEIQAQVSSQVQKKHGQNMLSDALNLLSKTSNQNDLLKNITTHLNSKKRYQEMISEVKEKNKTWKAQIDKLRTDQKQMIKNFQEIKNNKNAIKQIESLTKAQQLIKTLNKNRSQVETLINDVQKYKKKATSYPQEIEKLIQQDINEIQKRMSLPKVDFKDLAHHLFSAQFAKYLVQGQKYKKLADQYLPEKKKENDEIIPPRRNEGKTYHFPLKKGYPFFWLKKAFVSSTGNSNSYSGQISGTLSDLSTAPNIFDKPFRLGLSGDFPKEGISGLELKVSSDYTKKKSQHHVLLEVASFPTSKKVIAHSSDLDFSLDQAFASTQIKGFFQEENMDFSWSSILNQPQFTISSPSQELKSLLTEVTKTITQINIQGRARGTLSNFKMNLSSNLADDLKDGIEMMVQKKINETNKEIKRLLDQEIKVTKDQFAGELQSQGDYLKKFTNIQKTYQKYEANLKKELKKIQTKKLAPELEKLKKQGKKLLKGIKF